VLSMRSKRAGPCRAVSLPWAVALVLSCAALAPARGADDTPGAPGSPAVSGTGVAAAPAPYRSTSAVPIGQAPAFASAVIQGGTIPPGWQPQAVTWPAINADGRPTTMVVAPTYTFTYAVGPPVPMAVPVARPQVVARPQAVPGWTYAMQSAPPAGYQLPTQVARPVPWQYPPGAPVLAGTPIVAPGPPPPVVQPMMPPPMMVAPAPPPPLAYPPPIYAGPPSAPQSLPVAAAPPPFIQPAAPDQWVPGVAAPGAPANVGQPGNAVGQSLAAAAPPVIAGSAAAIAAGQPSNPPPPVAPQSAPLVPVATGPAAPAGAAPRGTVHVWRVVGVHDGDTITCLDETNVQQKVRLAEIDAPEIGQDFGKVSREALADLVFGKTVQVVDQGKDRYGRWIGRVSVGGTDVNRQMVASGNAWHYATYSQDAALAGLQAQAQAQRLGLWAEANPTPPWDYRRASQPPATT